MHKKVYTFGNGDHGKLGHGDVRKVSVPTLVERLVNLHVVKVLNMHAIKVPCTGLRYSTCCRDDTVHVMKVLNMLVMHAVKYLCFNG